MGVVLRTPLDIPELRAQIRQFVSIADAVACSQVCKDWTDDFTSVVWHTIDFGVHETFRALDPQVVTRNGHRIRIIRRLQNALDISALQNDSICNLVLLSIHTMKTRTLIQAQCNRIIHRNLATLRALDCILPDSIAEHTQPFPVEGLAPRNATSSVTIASHLTTLTLSVYHISRTRFSEILKACPALQSLTFVGQLYPQEGESRTAFYQHPGVTYFASSVEGIFPPSWEDVHGPASDDPFTLLAHFPKLKTWSTWTRLDHAPEPIKREIARSCPEICAFHTRIWGDLMVELLSRALSQLTEICLASSNISLKTASAILTHRETLTSIKNFSKPFLIYTTDPQQDTSESIPNPDRRESTIINMIPQACARLKTIHLVDEELDMDEVERTTWVCQNLETLFIRIRHLDTKKKVDDALWLWASARRGQTDIGRLDKLSASQLDDECAAADSHESRPSIEVRVARHLLQFEKLSVVWLGTKVYSA
ncbi:hypothetical protein BGZ98_009122 [Dissophora globulifera]|nr:hypothetical protein BGZ98_009122 [Dissophora globulifera]